MTALRSKQSRGRAEAKQPKRFARTARRPNRLPSAGPNVSLDVAVDLQRQHTLLQMMSERLRESATAMELTGTVPASRLERALDVHRRFLVEVHLANEDEVATRLRQSGASAARKLADRCAREHPHAAQFERAAALLLEAHGEQGSVHVTRLAELFRGEADRIERHHLAEEEPLIRNLDRWLAPQDRADLARGIRRRDAVRADAEDALVSWSAELHPAAD